MDEQASIQQMNEIERALKAWLEEKTRGVEAAIVAGALLRRVRALYELYPESTRELFEEGAVAFLQRRDVEAEQRAAEAGIILPPGGRIPS